MRGCTPYADGSELAFVTPAGPLRAHARGARPAHGAQRARGDGRGARRGCRAGRDRARDSPGFAPVTGRLEAAARQFRRASCSTTRTTRIPIRCAPRSTCSPRRSGRALAGAGRHGRGGRRRSRVPSRDRRLRAGARRRRACMRAGDLAREAVAAFGAGATHYASAMRRRSTSRATRSACGRHAAGQGLALHADGARGGGAHRPSSAEGGH